MNDVRVLLGDTFDRDAFALFDCQWMHGRLQLDEWAKKLSLRWTWVFKRAVSGYGPIAAFSHPKNGPICDRFSEL